MIFRSSKIALAVVLGLSLSACGGGDSDDKKNENGSGSSNTYSRSVFVEGIVNSKVSHLTNATVCIDVNKNFQCDDGEINAKTNAQGIANLTWQSNNDFVGHQVIAVSNDKSQVLASYILADDAYALSTQPTALSNVYVNSITHLVVAYMKATNTTDFVHAAEQLAVEWGFPYSSSQLYTGTMPDSLYTLAKIFTKLGYSASPAKSSSELLQELPLHHGAYTHISGSLNNGIAENAYIEQVRQNYVDTLQNNGSFDAVIVPLDNSNEVVNTPPVADFVYSAIGLKVSFSNLSRDNEDSSSELTYEWAFGDGNTSKEREPTHTFAQAGSYLVRLTVTDKQGGVSYRSLEIKLAKTESTPSVNHEPIADFSFSASANDANTIVFKNLSKDYDKDELSYRWYFGDGETSTETNPTHSYQSLTQDKDYLVYLIVSDGYAIKSFTLPVHIKGTGDSQPPVVPGVNTKPKALFDVTYDSNNPFKVVFANQSTDADGDELTYSWDFGDGSQSEDKAPAHTYPTLDVDKVYVVKLTVSDGKLTDVYSTSLTIRAKAPEVPENTAPVAKFTSQVAGQKVTFTDQSTDADGDKLSYEWAFGDGSTSTQASPTHTYAALTEDKEYQVSLTVSDGLDSHTVTSSVTIAAVKDEDPKDYLDLATCETFVTQQCSDKEVCETPLNAFSFARFSPLATTPAVTEVSTTYYATNPKNQVGKNKTITSMADWTTDMIVAQGAANDDPRAYRGGHEKPTDFYALYAAWDDANLYVMVEMSLDEGQWTAGGDFDYSSDQFLPMGIGIRTGQRPAGNGILDTGTNVWTSGEFYTIEEGIDTLLMFHPRLPTVNTPGIFFTNSQGKFSYDSENGYLLGFDKAGITRSVETAKVSPAYYGVPARYGRTLTDYLNDSEYAAIDAVGRLYQVTIPLTTLGVTKAQIEADGLGLMAFSTFGESMMDALPWTPNLIDNALEAYSKDDSTSKEKEDFDLYDVKLARVGNLKGALDGQPVTPNPDPDPKDPLPPVCTTQQVCTPVLTQVPELCFENAALSVTSTVVSGGDETASSITYEITAAGDIAFVGYRWKQDGKAINGKSTKTISITLAKGTTEKQVTIDVLANDTHGIKSGEGSLTLTVPARQTTGGLWDSAELTGDYATDVPVYSVSSCQVNQPAQGLSILLHASEQSVPNIWAYKDATTNYTSSGKWPGDAMSPVEGCENLFEYKIPQTDTATVIFSNVNGAERYPGEMASGLAFDRSTFNSQGCFDWESKEQKDLNSCLSIPNGEIKVYAGVGVADSIYSFKYDADNQTGDYINVPLFIFGEGVDRQTQGVVSVDGVESSFVNGQILRIGEGVAAVDVAAGEVPQDIVVTLSYQGVTQTYTYRKVLKSQLEGGAFSWDNAYIYFVMTDRFEDGNPSNNNSYGRPATDPTGSNLATFHGGDIKGLTNNLDYIQSLGMNAIWITAPYEQIHGWTGGGDDGSFAHYAYHGYYLLDTTAMDANMGTVNEFREFVTQAHQRGLRVVLDVVMNHTGYANLTDMCEFGFGATTTGVAPCDAKNWKPGAGETWHNKPIKEELDPAWNTWWGKEWLLFGGYGEQCTSGDGLDSCVAFLPDFKNTNPNGSPVAIPSFLQTKWAQPKADYDIPAAIPYRSGTMSVAQFQAEWLAAWVREFGIDGFRIDTAKHVSKETWGVLKQKSDAALKEWRNNTSANDDPAALWGDNFWMTGEHWGFKHDPSDGSSYAKVGGFDSMLNFEFNGGASKSNLSADGNCALPTAATFDNYASMYNTGTAKLKALSYVSSHDTSLCRKAGKQQEMGTMMALLPGGVQIYYGDETYRPNTGIGGTPDEYEHGTRSLMNFPADIKQQAKWVEGIDAMGVQFSSDPNLAHWQKVGQFRNRNLAVGGGAQTKTSNAICRQYDNGEVSNSVVIVLATTSGTNVQVDVGSCFAEGTQVQDGYTGNKATVSGGKVSFTAGGSVILVEEARTSSGNNGGNTGGDNGGNTGGDNNGGNTGGDNGGNTGGDNGGNTGGDNNGGNTGGDNGGNTGGDNGGNTGGDNGGNLGHDPNVPRSVFVHLFEWKWNDIAKECETVLGPKGFSAVQVSPPQESIPGSQWWTRYQPVSYEFTGRSGNRAEFESMVSRCKAVGVDIYVDAVINHMAAWNYDFPKVPFGANDFNDCRSDVSNYNDRYNVQYCNLVGLNDLKTGSEYVRQKIADYMNDALSMGVAGFRIDAAKHMPSEDLAAIINKLNNTKEGKKPYVFLEVIGGGGEPVKTHEYTGIGSVTEFYYARTVGNLKKGGNFKDLNGIGSWADWLASDKAVVFVTNHDEERHNPDNTLLYKDSSTYTLANIFMLAYPYGYPKLMSGYQFNDFDAGPPSSGVHSGNSCQFDGGDWVCEHQWRPLANMVEFRNYTLDQWKVTNWWDNGSNQIAFGRGGLGFVVINKQGNSLNQSFSTGMPEGSYCNIIVADYDPATKTCSGEVIQVNSSGQAQFSVSAMDAAAIHVGARIGG